MWPIEQPRMGVVFRDALAVLEKDWEFVSEPAPEMKSVTLEDLDEVVD